jgi:hypothetical protein
MRRLLSRNGEVVSYESPRRRFFDTVGSTSGACPRGSCEVSAVDDDEDDDNDNDDRAARLIPTAADAAVNDAGAFEFEGARESV